MRDSPIGLLTLVSSEAGGQLFRGQTLTYWEEGGTVGVKRLPVLNLGYEVVSLE